MQRLMIVFILGSFLTACQTFFRDADPNPKTSLAPGEVAFDPLAGMDRKQYLIEQHALIRSKLMDKGVESKIEGQTLTVNIPGNIAFGINSARMNWNVHNILDKISSILKEYKYTSILVLGHSDSKGDQGISFYQSSVRG